MPSKIMWLAVEVGEGMFPTERAVKMRTDEGEISLFVAESDVKTTKTGTARICVELLDSDENYGLIEVPGQQGPMIVKVEKKHLAEAA